MFLIHYAAVFESDEGGHCEYSCLCVLPFHDELYNIIIIDTHCGLCAHKYCFFLLVGVFKAVHLPTFFQQFSWFVATCEKPPRVFEKGKFVFD